MKLSVVIIAKNAEENIADAIDSVRQLANEIIVVDNSSTDRTVDVAKYSKAEVVTARDKDFSQLRNIGLAKAKGEWVLYIDTDERTTQELCKSIELRINNQESGIVAYRVKRKNFYLGNNEWPYIEKMERLFKKEKLLGWRGQLHESPVVEGLVGELGGFLLHYTHRDLTSMLAKTIEWSKLEAETRFKANHPKMNILRFTKVMAAAFFNSYIRQKGYKVGIVGIIESIYQAFSMFITYARLWELQNAKNSR